MRIRFVVLSVFCATLLSALAEPAHAAVAVKINDVKHGSLLLRSQPTADAATDANTDPNLYDEAPLLGTDVSISVTGQVVRATVTQRFRNQSAGFVEGTYAFPLSESAAVDSLMVKVGNRTIVGRIEEKKNAERIYSDAKRAGKVASLVEQLRPNLFTTAVANIPPGEVVSVTIGFQDSVRVEAGRGELRFPLAVTPRYTPPASKGTRAVVPADVHLTSTGTAGEVSIAVHLISGFPLARVASTSHLTTISADAQDGVHVTLSKGPHGDRDFVLEWDARPLTAPVVSTAQERTGDGHFTLLMLTPPTTNTEAAVVGSDTIFVLDSSGSMAGSSMDAAKDAVRLAVERLPSNARFNIIDFDSQARSLFAGLRDANDNNKQAAAKLIDGISADGGTEMASALELALSEQSASGSRRMRQIVFITDGSVSNEEQLFTLLRDKLGRARLYTVGIGAAPNSYFMRKAAELGRGTSVFVASADEVQSRMLELFDKIDSPVLTNLELIVEGGSDVEMWPRHLPDLFLGEPLSVAIKSGAPIQGVVLEGMSGETPVRLAVRLAVQVTDGNVTSRGVAKLWARRKIDSLTDARRGGAVLTAQLAAIEKETLDVALRFHLVSEFTSLVAVDTTPVRRPDQALGEMAVPTPAPAGMMPRGATNWPLQVLLGLALAIIAALMIARERERT